MQFQLPVLLHFRTLLIVVCCVSYSLTVNAEEVPETNPLQFFYKNPDIGKIPRIIQQMEDQGLMANKSSRPPIIGFLAAIFEQYPKQIDALITGKYRPETDYAIATSLALAGMSANAIEIAKRNNWSAKLQSTLRSLPTMEEMPVNSASKQDLLWGASVATGNAKYPNKIIDSLAIRIKDGGFELHELIIASQVGGDNYKKEYRALFEKYGEKKFTQLIVMGSALWSISSNALQHNFIAEALLERIKQEGETDFGYLLERRTFQQEGNIISSESGAELDVMFSGSVDKGIVETINDDTRNSKLDYMETFKNIFEKDDPVHLVEILYVKEVRKGECAYKITAPNGAKFLMGPYTTDGTKGIYASSVKIDPKKLTHEGVYSIEGSCDDGPNNTLAVSWKFFVAKR